MDITLKYFDVLTPISLNLLIQSTSLKNQKIIHRWDYGRAKPTWTTQSSKNISKVLDHLKLGLNDETTPDSLAHKDITDTQIWMLLKFLQ
jgi:hypothetical protein